MALKTLHVISSVATRSGGPATVLLQLSRQQARDGHQVTLCTTNRDAPSGLLPVPCNVPIVRDGVTTWHFASQSFPLRFSRTMATWLHANIREFDVVHVHGLYRFPTTFAAWCARRTGTPYLICPHGSLDPFLHQQSHYNLVLKRLYERLFDRPNLDGASAILYTAEEERQKASALKLKARAVVVPNGLAWDDYETLPPAGGFRARAGIPEHAPLVLFLGRINFKKGLDLLVPAFAQVLRAVPDARLAIVGPDNEGYGRSVRRWCNEQGIRSHTTFVDHLDPESVRQAYVDADVFALPSYSENFGMTVAEAMACRCPVVISDQVNIWREVKRAGAGQVTRLDIPEIADALTALLRSDEDTLHATGEAGRKLVKQQYTWAQISQQLTQVYETLSSHTG